MCDYRPNSATRKDESSFLYVHRAPLRILAGACMCTISGAPLALFAYVVYSLFWHISNVISPLIAPLAPVFTALFAIGVPLEIIRNSSPSRRPPTAAGCIPDDATALRQRVAVIGAGISGLMTAKELQAEGHDVVVYEAASQVGGAWFADGAPDRGRVWRHTVSSSSALNTAISDLELPSYYADQEDPYHVTQDRFLEYIEEYATRFDLMPLVRLSTTVQSVHRTNDMWTIISRDCTGTESTESFAYCAVCTGQVQQPQMPSISGADKFSGDILHVSTIRDASHFVGKRVVCVGSGETASDVAEAVAQLASACYLSVRNPFVCLPRNFYGVAPDFFETRALYRLPAWLRWAVLKSQLLCMTLLPAWRAQCQSSGRERRVPRAATVLRSLFTRRYLWDVISGSRSPCASLGVTKSERMFYAIDDGRAVMKPALTRVDEHGVHFVDGSYVRADAVLLNTGYDSGRFPVLRETNLEHCCARTRYLLTFKPIVGASLAFIGFCRGHAGSLVMTAEMQARWFALIVSGKRRLPSRNAMEEAVTIGQKYNQCYSATLGGWFLTNFIAKHHVGCEPNALRIALEHGPLVAWRIHTQSFAAYQYRFEGPHANAEFAAGVYSRSASCGKPVAWYIIEILAMMLGLLFYYVSADNEGGDGHALVVDTVEWIITPRSTATKSDSTALSVSSPLY